MTKQQLIYVREIINKIKEPDEHVAKAIAYINKDLAEYAARRGQLKDQYDYDSTSY